MSNKTFKSHKKDIENIDIINEKEEHESVEETYNEELIILDVEQKVYEVCKKTLFFINHYVKEKSIPLCEQLTYGDLYDFLDIFDENVKI